MSSTGTASVATDVGSSVATDVPGAGGGGGGGKTPATLTTTGDGTRTTDTISSGYATGSGILIVGGLPIDPSQWSVSGTTLTYAFTPANGASIAFYYQHS